MNVINDYGIASKVGYFMIDNASNNDTIIEALSTCKYILFNQHQIVYNVKHHRLRCNGYIINLVAQSFLFHTNDEDLAIENNKGLLAKPTELEMQQ